MKVLSIFSPVEFKKFLHQNTPKKGYTFAASRPEMQSEYKFLAEKEGVQFTTQNDLNVLKSRLEQDPSSLNAYIEVDDKGVSQALAVLLSGNLDGWSATSSTYKKEIYRALNNWAQQGYMVNQFWKGDQIAMVDKDSNGSNGMFLHVKRNNGQQEYWPLQDHFAEVVESSGANVVRTNTQVNTNPNGVPNTNVSNNSEVTNNTRFERSLSNGLKYYYDLGTKAFYGTDGQVLSQENHNGQNQYVIKNNLGEKVGYVYLLPDGAGAMVDDLTKGQPTVHKNVDKSKEVVVGSAEKTKTLTAGIKDLLALNVRSDSDDFKKAFDELVTELKNKGLNFDDIQTKVTGNYYVRSRLSDGSRIHHYTDTDADGKYEMNVINSKGDLLFNILKRLKYEGVKDIKITQLAENTNNIVSSLHIDEVTYFEKYDQEFAEFGEDEEGNYSIKPFVIADVSYAKFESNSVGNGAAGYDPEIIKTLWIQQGNGEKMPLPGLDLADFTIEEPTEYQKLDDMDVAINTKVWTLKSGNSTVGMIRHANNKLEIKMFGDSLGRGVESLGEKIKTGLDAVKVTAAANGGVSLNLETVFKDKLNTINNSSPNISAWSRFSLRNRFETQAKANTEIANVMGQFTEGLNKAFNDINNKLTAHYLAKALAESPSRQTLSEDEKKVVATALKNAKQELIDYLEVSLKQMKAAGKDNTKVDANWQKYLVNVHKVVTDTPRSKDVNIWQSFDSYLKNYKSSLGVDTKIFESESFDRRWDQ